MNGIEVVLTETIGDTAVVDHVVVTKSVVDDVLTKSVVGAVVMITAVMLS